MSNYTDISVFSEKVLLTEEEKSADIESRVASFACSIFRGGCDSLTMDKGFNKLLKFINFYDCELKYEYFRNAINKTDIISPNSGTIIDMVIEKYMFSFAIKLFEHGAIPNISRRENDATAFGTILRDLFQISKRSKSSFSGFSIRGIACVKLKKLFNAILTGNHTDIELQFTKAIFQSMKPVDVGYIFDLRYTQKYTPDKELLFTSCKLLKRFNPMITSCGIPILDGLYPFLMPRPLYCTYMTSIFDVLSWSFQDSCVKIYQDSIYLGVELIRILLESDVVIDDDYLPLIMRDFKGLTTTQVEPTLQLDLVKKIINIPYFSDSYDIVEIIEKRAINEKIKDAMKKYQFAMKNRETKLIKTTIESILPMPIHEYITPHIIQYA